MTQSIAQNRFKKLVDDISRLYLNARRAQVHFAWGTGRRSVEEEQNGQIRAEYGSGLLRSLSDELSKKYGAGFSVHNLQRMRRFYADHPNYARAHNLSWSHYIELMPIEDKTTIKQLEQRILKENLTREKRGTRT